MLKEMDDVLLAEIRRKKQELQEKQVLVVLSCDEYRLTVNDNHWRSSVPTHHPRTENTRNSAKLNDEPGAD